MCEISVIVPAYNVGHYLAECLDSLLAQTFVDFEAIIVDDGSTDNTPDIIARYCAADPRLRSIRQNNNGVSAARNLALAQATGTFVAFLDGDDIYTPEALATLYRRATESGADLVIGDYEIFDSLHAWGIASMRTLMKQPSYDRFDQALLLCYVVWNKLFRRSVIEGHALRFAPISFAEDSVFSMAFAYRSSAIVTVDAVICRYRRRSYAAELSATQVITMRSETDHLEAHARVRHEAIAQLDAWVAEAADEQERATRERAKASYLDGLLGKEVANLIDLRYRTFWNAEPGVAALIADRVDRAREGMSYKTWSDLRRSVRDLPLGHLPRTRADVAAHPLIGVAVFAEDSDAEELVQTLHSLYIQSFPRFRVFVPRSVLESVTAHYAAFENMHAVDESSEAAFYDRALEMAGTDYLLFTRAGFLYRSSALLRMFAALKNGNADLATFPVSRVSDDELPAVYPLQQLAFENLPDARDYRLDRNQRFDCLLANKLIRRTYLNTLKFRFSGNSVADAERILTSACFMKSVHKVVHTPLDSATFMRRFVGGRTASLFHKLADYADRTLPPRRRAGEVLLLDTRGQGFSQNLLSTRNAALEGGLTPRFLFTTLDVKGEAKVQAELLARVKRSMACADAVVCASDSIPTDASAPTRAQRRLLLQTPRLNTVIGCSSGVLTPGDRYTDVVVQSRAFEASVRGATRWIGLPATDVVHDEARMEGARRRLYSLRPDAVDRKLLVLTSHVSAKKLFAGVDAEELASQLDAAGYLVVAAVGGLSAVLADHPASLSDVIFDASGCFLSFDQIVMADILVTSRFADAVYRSAADRPMLFWSRSEETGMPEISLPAALRRMALSDLNELPMRIDDRPWEVAVDAFAETFVKPNGFGSAHRVVSLLQS